MKSSSLLFMTTFVYAGNSPSRNFKWLLAKPPGFGICVRYADDGRGYDDVHKEKIDQNETGLKFHQFFTMHGNNQGPYTWPDFVVGTNSHEAPNEKDLAISLLGLTVTRLQMRKI
ncbi:uncharacterized protein LACBIDRAFT_309810 [Laccaria bicolor S238N-H82]|uniref:Predicted protein n=1 Tax=Laccaria bicolor (strain S238N-H82 / ATCC MYA-4686) TaxID=486041 RepID=B0DT36_LACBS|nr:uncharacterized protein LACBIDRAFT_309810 [Laccaria bicolor S238N-H82]EDR02153.1 predicted protein [Laccaria bicolor S238N-H82]|eukprot:XP_001887098.1 predicted protein [Laccaria bicolor S238N-H82]